jgi:hypothetical protein
MRSAALMAVTLTVLLGTAVAEPGIPIAPDEDGLFTYEDDFSSPGVFQDAMTDNLDATCWEPGRLVNSGPNRNRAIIYRFHGERPIHSLNVRVEQAANGRSLGGRNTLYLSANGLDWQEAATSGDQEANASGWQDKPLDATWDAAHRDADSIFTGGSELWLRIVLDNYSGLKTNPSNHVNTVSVEVSLADEAGAGEVSDTAQDAWAALCESAQWRTYVMDLTEPEAPPHYVEGADGWLEPAHSLATDVPGLLVARRYSREQRPCLGMAAFVTTAESAEPVMAKLTFQANRTSHREFEVLWDGEPLATLDLGSFFDRDMVHYVTVPGPHEAGTHELRLQGRDVGASALIRRIELAGPGIDGWRPKPPLPEGGALDVLAAYYMPDPPPPPDSQAVEGRRADAGAVVFKGLQRMYQEHADFGAVRVVFKNTGAVPVRLDQSLGLNGKPIESSYVDFVESKWDARGVVWYRVRPRTLEPGETGQAYVRFRRRPDGNAASFTLSGENFEPVTVSVPFTDPGVTVDYVTTGEDFSSLYVYARRTGEAGQLARATLDGAVLEQAAIYGADFPGGVALSVAKLAEPLAVGDYHVVGIETADGQRVAAQFRVAPFVLPRSSIHVPANIAQSMHMNLLTWRMHGFETCAELGIPTTCMDSEVLHAHAMVSHIFAPDEPDAKDNRGGGYDKGLGWHARMLQDSGWQELVERHDPPMLSWMNMNGTIRPLNWCVYGQFGDVNGFDPYPVTYYGADHAYVRESLEYGRMCCAPSRLYAILEAYGWAQGQGVAKGVRGPIPQEYRQNAVQAIGVGMKGLTSWVHSQGAGGWQLNKPVQDEIAKVNQLIAHIEKDLLLGTPVDLATSDAGTVLTGVVGNETWPKERVWVGSLLCGPDTIVLAVANHIPAARPELPEIVPAENVMVTVRLPEYLRDAEAYEVTEAGIDPYASQTENGQVILRIERIESGRVFVLRGANEARAR